MKKLLYLLLLVSFGAQAQFTNQTVRKTIANGTYSTTPGLDTLPRVTGVLLNGRPLVYNSVLNKWTASLLTGSGIDTTAIQTVANFFPKGDTRYALSSAIPSNYWTTNSTQTGLTGDKTTSGTITAGSLVAPTGSFSTSVVTPSILINGNSALFGFSGSTFIRPNLAASGIRLQNFAGSNILQLNDDFTAVFTGAVTGVTATANSNNTKLATTAYVDAATGGGLTFASGTYVPTFTLGANISSATNRKSTYTRVGSMVSGTIMADVVTTGAATLNISLPIASNFTTGYDLLGLDTLNSASLAVGNPATVDADATNDNMVITLANGTYTVTFGYSYEIK